VSMSRMKPEDAIGAKARPFTGAEYLASLRDDREVYIYGERVADVTEHPAFRNTARSLARLYDALHDPKTKPVLTSATDTGSGGYTHKYFRVARSREDVVAQRDAIAAWARMSYGWLGRSPDYKASLMNTLGANSQFYGKFADNAKAWYRRAQEYVLFMNHAIVNPPLDRAKAPDQVKDVFITIQKETDAGIIVSGAKVVATSSALTHYNFLGQNAAVPTHDTDLAVMFIAPMNAPGVKLFCRTSYEMMASVMGTPFDYPLSSRFDENDAIFVFDNVFIPWEDILIYRDVEKLKTFYPRSGFVNGFQFQGCTRLAVKLDFLAGVIIKALRVTGADEFRGNQAMLGEVVAWRNLFWAISDAMAMNPVPWTDSAVLPNAQSGSSYRVFAGDAYRRCKEIVEKIIASALIYLPSSTKDFENPSIDKYLAKYVRGSNNIGYRERIKIMKLLWDAVGTEFGGRHELYELNYTGNHENTRIELLRGQIGDGKLDSYRAFVDRCLAEYDLDGWQVPDLTR
jgi:4-hydroxyphenylacetate 3-monooxygenase